VRCLKFPTFLQQFEHDGSTAQREKEANEDRFAYPVSKVVGKNLLQLDLRKKYSVTLLAIRRSSGIIANPDADLVLRSGDVLVLMGSPEMISKVTPLFVGGDI